MVYMGSIFRQEVSCLGMLRWEILCGVILSSADVHNADEDVVQ